MEDVGGDHQGQKECIDHYPYFGFGGVFYFLEDCTDVVCGSLFDGDCRPLCTDVLSEVK